ncbi:MAG TPA: ATP-binding cassette domain-containing protein, partial [Roseiarcus sp.]|nr:ATP-binding cassette domain-containing protein [Roseiarcus sp.]
IKVGWFHQHQIEALDPADTPLDILRRERPEDSESSRRSRLAQFGLSFDKQETTVANLSGGERARLLLNLVAMVAPHLLILDEPTNHLDIDSRAELIEAINEYEGACILVSHDRRLLEACVDRLWLVANGTVRVFEGDVADYSRFVLGQGAPQERAKKESEPVRPASAPEPRETAKPRRDLAPLRKEIIAVEQKMHRFQDLLRRVDEALAQAGETAGNSAKVVDLAGKRAELEAALAAAEEAWLELSAQAEAVG